MIIREFVHGTDDPCKLWQLQETVYPGSKYLRERWSWEIENYPFGNVRIFVAEVGNRFVGMTMRMPVNLHLKGKNISGCFATNSMVMDEFRGQGIIGDLYSFAERTADIQLSKGTAPAMFNRLLTMGYREILPNNYLTCILSPMNWILWKLVGRTYWMRPFHKLDRQYSDIKEIKSFESGFQNLDSNFSSSIAQTKAFFEWRYLENPQKNYQVFERILGQKTVSRFVVRVSGSSAFLVDLRWDTLQKDEPDYSISFAKAFSISQKAVKITTWCTLADLRNRLKKNGFITRKDSPAFSFYCSSDLWEKFDWEDIHIVHGDGDVEYL